MIKNTLMLLAALCCLLGCNADISVQDETTDPVAQDYPLAYVSRPLADQDSNPFQLNLNAPEQFNPGARLIIKQNAFAESAERELLTELFGDSPLDIKDLTVSPDGDTLLFALRPPALADVPDELQPSWSIWRYSLSSDTLAPVIADPLRAELGHDINPAFLADGRIVFSSSRQQKARQILLDEFKPQYSGLHEGLQGPAFNLHVMNIDGSGIEQISFNLSHDLYPLVQPDGHILYSRWDNQSDRNMYNWYQMRPDGSANQLVYGWHSHQTGPANSRVDFAKPLLLADGEIATLLSQRQQAGLNAMPVQIALALASDNAQPLYQQVLNLPAQTPLLPWNFDNAARPEPSGFVQNLFALQDGSSRFLVSWSPCQVMVEEQVIGCALVADPAAYPLASPRFGLWLFDLAKQTQVPVKLGSDQLLLSEAVVMQHYPRPVFLPANPAANPELAGNGEAILDIRSVYDIGGEAVLPIAQLADPMQTSAAQRPVRYLSLIRGVPIPPEAVREVPNFAFGVNRRQLMRELVGITPVQPDGSVRVTVPANVPLALSLLNSEGQAISAQHQQWITLAPGETLSCNGCHAANNTRPHGRQSGEWPTINPGPLNAASSFTNANPRLPPNAGETMAQTMARLLGEQRLSAALDFEDLWTDPALRQPDPAELNQFTELATATPVGLDCFASWQAACRLRIDYPVHIQPLWQLDRRQFDPLSNELVRDNTCVSCHSRTDAAGNTQLPAAQLELTAQASDLQAQQMTSYRELLSNDNEQELVGGVLVDRLVQAVDANGNPVFLRDAEGELILDDNGQPIPLMVTVTVPASMRAGSALASVAFFQRFAQGGSHQGYLSPAELRLLSHWLDMGGQYYNSPFAVELE
ncbi:hypothetical protein WG68_17415 [Arsukibacterium ikkense]|uniref:Hydrazine synthase alpha subunit middle domain-containing protein n=1 Tax=Arsukibacterium ikkense TaxID=336831 RepID=A0A0M2V373_9GAMM|nr:PD40 domain-containing protein [Arsukibacterium ikkense]KKO44095.1 hypothetical protein WG68_17415 [Arsukibacterium ikkense]